MAYSVVDRDLCEFKIKADESILKKANDYILKKKFDLGEGVKKEEVLFSTNMVSLLYSKTCENIENIHKYYVQEHIEYNEKLCTCEKEIKNCNSCKKTIM